MSKIRIGGIGSRSIYLHHAALELLVSYCCSECQCNGMFLVGINSFLVKIDNLD